VIDQLVVATMSEQIVEGIGAAGEVGDAYFESFPPGFRFRPNHIELLGYLKAKVFNEPLPTNPIREVQLYEFHPQRLTGKSIDL
jgi:hypothetical protein